VCWSKGVLEQGCAGARVCWSKGVLQQGCAAARVACWLDALTPRVAGCLFRLALRLAPERAEPGPPERAV
jgi:hypothetical protein